MKYFIWYPMHQNEKYTHFECITDDRPKFELMVS